MKKRRNDELKTMVLAFVGGYILGKTGMLDDPGLGKVIGQAIEVWIDGKSNIKAGKPDAK